MNNNEIKLPKWVIGVTMVVVFGLLVVVYLVGDSQTDTREQQASRINKLEDRIQAIEMQKMPQLKNQQGQIVVDDQGNPVSLWMFIGSQLQALDNKINEKYATTTEIIE